MNVWQGHSSEEEEEDELAHLGEKLSKARVGIIPTLKVNHREAKNRSTSGIPREGVQVFFVLKFVHDRALLFFLSE